MTIASNFEEPRLQQAQLNTARVVIAAQENGAGSRSDLQPETSDISNISPTPFVRDPLARRRVTDLSMPLLLGAAGFLTSPHACRNRLTNHAGFERKTQLTGDNESNGQHPGSMLWRA